MSQPQIDELDQKILNQLCFDGRRSNVDIARAVDASEGTVRRRIKRLLESEAAAIIVAVNPVELGYRTEIMLWLRVQVGKLESVAQQLARFEQVEYVGLLTGDFDILVRALFRSTDEVYDFVAHKLAAIDGVVSSHTAYVLKVVKRSRFLFPIDDRNIRETPV